ncbi:MAG TPA: ABC transporter [Lachnoclostridium phytofermentans]|uniref:ABC transporter n=1 Tax=Lachnoclostridium phytofermentans TaxID=66219 RepID=A0A3D2X3P4_9FIRM|nr:ATP-binding cassette domain-containing protein [Lachnoclostridium sp.]HCL01317.1 ABC transporter [Lachnoclostridium phytofermentans]
MSLIVHIEKKLKNFTLKVDFESKESCLGILGASGCGKSMTLKCIAGIVTPEKGYIELNGKVLFDSDKKINLSPQQRKVGYLFQNYALFPNMTVYENIGVGIKASKREKDSIILKMIENFKLEGLEDQYPSKLSGGQQQRVALARMLAYEPDVLLFDEPFSAMDSYLKEELQILLSDLLNEYHGDAVMVTHSRDEVYRFCKDIIVLDSGKILEFGETKKIFANPRKVQTARLTGCKNISRAIRISDNQVEALDWGCLFTVKSQIPEKITHIGIRAHALKACHEPMDKRNLLPGMIYKIAEAPFEWNVLVQIEDNKNDTKKDIKTISRAKLFDETLVEEKNLFNLTNQKDPVVLWKISKSGLSSSFHENAPIYLTVAPEDILLLE